MCPWALHVVSVHAELTLGHLRYRLTDVPPQSNSPSDSVLGTGCRPVVPALVARKLATRTKDAAAAGPERRNAKSTAAALPRSEPNRPRRTSTTRFRQTSFTLEAERQGPLRPSPRPSGTE